MLLAIGYVLITQDNPLTKPLIDWNFINNNTIGFDKTTLPDGADPEDNYHDYVLGLDVNGNPAPAGHKNFPPKTPEWASEITGVTPEKIRSFAIEIAQTKPVAFMESDASARINGAQTFGQAFAAVASLIGSIGVSGGGTGQTRHSAAGNVGPALVSAGSAKTTIKAPTNPVKLRVNNNETWNAVLTGEYTSGLNTKTKLPTQMIYFTKGSLMQTTVGQAKAIQAVRQVEFVLATDFHMATGCRYADVVLPVTTRWERDNYITSPNREALFWADRVIDPLF
jgi:anaerobic dimethyl sulfoxide reductase subunit A